MIRKSILQSVAVVFFVGTLTASALAESETAKVSANEVIERNAEQIAAIGDTVNKAYQLGRAYEMKSLKRRVATL